MLPNEQYRRIWEQLQQQFDPDAATRLMVESLYLAAKLDKETSIAYWLLKQLRETTLTLSRLQQQFRPPPVPRMETSVVEQHALADYDRLLQYESSPKRQRDFTHSSEISATASHQAAVASF